MSSEAASKLSECLRNAAAMIDKAQEEAAGADWAVDMLARAVIASGGLLQIACDNNNYGTLYRDGKFVFVHGDDGLRIRHNVETEVV